MLSFWSSWLLIKWRKNAENEQGEKAGYFWSLISYESRYLRSLNFIRLLRVVITPSLSGIKFRMKFRLTICQDSRGGGEDCDYFFPALLLRAILHYPNAWNRLGNISTEVLFQAQLVRRATKAGTNSWLKRYMLKKILFELVLALHRCISVISCFVFKATKKNWSNRQRKKYGWYHILFRFIPFFYALYKLTCDVASSFPFSLEG